MAEATKIEWADATFNPWVGCTKISPACDHCYAESWAKRAGHPELWQGSRRRTSASNWRQPLKWNREAEQTGEIKRVFCASLADVFDNQAEDAWRADLWKLISETPRLTWMLLTKRPQNIAKMLPHDWKDGWPNVWLGATIENGDELRKRAHHLEAVPARVRFLSCEPLLGPLTVPFRVDWVITGGESGGSARPSDPAWFRDIRDQCLDTGVAYFHKQMTRKAPIPSDLLVRQFPT